jgi:hypothetical protein
MLPAAGPRPRPAVVRLEELGCWRCPLAQTAGCWHFPPLTDRRLMMPYLLGSGGSCTGHYGHDSIMRCGSDDRATPTRTALRTTVWSHKNQ